SEVDTDALIRAVERVCDVPEEDLCGKRKAVPIVLAKEVLIVSGKRLGANNALLASLTGLNSSTVSRRYDAAVARSKSEPEIEALIAEVIANYDLLKREKPHVVQHSLASSDLQRGPLPGPIPSKR